MPYCADPDEAGPKGCLIWLYTISYYLRDLRFTEEIVLMMVSYWQPSVDTVHFKIANIGNYQSRTEENSLL